MCAQSFIGVFMLKGLVFVYMSLSVMVFAQNVEITERNGALYFSNSHSLAESQGSISFKNDTSVNVHLQAVQTKNASAADPSAALLQFGVLRPFETKKVIFGDGVQDLNQYPECAARIDLCVWVKTEVGDYFEITDPDYNKGPLPFRLGVYIYRDSRWNH